MEQIAQAPVTKSTRIDINTEGVSVQTTATDNDIIFIAVFGVFALAAYPLRGGR